MCGIAGLVGLSPVNVETVKAMTAELAHRGPDGAGIWSAADGCVALGHRRLAVIDLLPEADQPMRHVSGELTIIFNGEIYNYRELAARLIAEKGVTFTTQSDTEVILEAYRAWGEDCVTELNGMFAFALYDQRKQTIFFARDRFGEKPLLFAEGPGWFAFASEYKALLRIQGVEAAVDEDALLRFLRWPADGLDHRRATLFSGIRQLLPAERMVLNLHDLSHSIRRYWELAPKAEYASLAEPDAQARFRDLLTDSVRLRLRSDVPLGSCLSGGLDSGAIVALARKLIGPEPDYHVFTGRFPGSAADEEGFTSESAKAANVTRHDCAPTPESFVADLPAFFWHNELPVDSASQYAQWCVFRAAREAGVTVLLDGQGADEILGGYEQYFANYLESLRRANHSIAEDEAAIRVRYPGVLPDVRHIGKRALPLGLRRTLARWTNKGSDMAFGLTNKAAHSLPPTPQEAKLLSLVDALRQDGGGGFLATLLRYGDRNSMAHAREVRLPFCDHRLAELSVSLPAAYLMGGAQTKRLLRESLRGVLPETVRTRWRKQGFQPPLAGWFDAKLISVAEDIFASQSFRSSGVWDAKWWENAARRFRNGERHLAQSLWKPMVSELWRRHFFHRACNLPKLLPLAAGS